MKVDMLKPGESRLFIATLLALRLLLGGLFLMSGLTKLIPGTFSAAGFLGNSIGPFAGFYTNLGNSSLIAAINFSVIWGETLIGAALIAGALVRFVSFWGIVQMVLYYTAALPPATGWISQQVIYTVVLLLFMFSGVGYNLGLDRVLIRFEKDKHPLRYLLG
jgi:thiosulfate dehydrogenase [quinone] large subunit